MSDESNDLMPSDLYKPSEKWWCDEEICRYLSKAFGVHLVGLHVAYLTEEIEGFALYTGFLYEHDGFPLWISAGHVVNDLEALRQSKAFTKVTAKWADMSKSDPLGDTGFPIDLDELHFLGIDKQGVDLGLCSFPERHYRLFMSNQTRKFLDKAFVLGAADANPEGYVLVGMPAAKHEVSQVQLESGNTLSHLIAPIYCLPLEKIEDRNEETPEEFWGGHGAFYGQLVPFTGESDIPQFSIEYMSGGLILSVERRGPENIDYRLFGIQSSWLPESKIIRATGVEVFLRVMDEVQRGMIDAAKGR